MGDGRMGIGGGVGGRWRDVMWGGGLGDMDDI